MYILDIQAVTCKIWGTTVLKKFENKINNGFFPEACGLSLKN